MCSDALIVSGMVLTAVEAPTAYTGLAVISGPNPPIEGRLRVLEPILPGFEPFLGLPMLFAINRGFLPCGLLDLLHSEFIFMGLTDRRDSVKWQKWFLAYSAFAGLWNQAAPRASLGLAVTTGSKASSDHLTSCVVPNAKVYSIRLEPRRLLIKAVDSRMLIKCPICFLFYSFLHA